MSDTDHVRSIALVTTERNRDACATLMRGVELSPLNQGSVDPGSVDPGSVLAHAGTARVSFAGVTVNVTMWTPEALVESGSAQDLGDVLDGVNGALFVLSATGGIPDEVIEAWDACDDIGLPRAVVITGIDAPTATTDVAIDMCQEALGDMVPVLAAKLPVLSDDEIPIGLIDVLTGEITDYSTPTPRSMPGEPQHRELIADEHAWLMEAIMSETENETLVARFLAGDKIDPHALLEELYAAVDRGRLHPLFLTAARPTGLGVDAIWELIVRGFRSSGGSRP